MPNTDRGRVDTFRQQVLTHFFKNAYLEKWQWQKWYLWNDADALLENDTPARELPGYLKNAGSIPSLLSQHLEAVLEPDANVLVLGSAGGDYLMQFGTKLKEKFPGGNPKIIGIDISYAMLKGCREKLNLLAAPPPPDPHGPHEHFGLFANKTGLAAVLAENKPYRKGPLVYFSRPGLLQAAARQVTLVNCDLLALPVRDHCMDIVFADNVLYWLSDLAAALLEVNRILKPGGRFVFHKEFTGMTDDYPVSFNGGFGKMPLSAILKRYGFQPETVCDYAGESGNKILLDFLKANNAVAPLPLPAQSRIDLPGVGPGDRDQCHGTCHETFAEGIFLIARKTGPVTAPAGEAIFQTVANPTYNEYLLGSMAAVDEKFRILFIDREGALYCPRPDNYKKIFMDGDTA